MLRKASDIHGCSILTTDGRIGTVTDLLFDDTTWLVRWLVVDTGNWLSGRKVLLPPSILGHIVPHKREFVVRLTKQQVKDCPGIETDEPVSRQMEAHIYDYYGWSPYWSNSFYMGGPYAMSPLPGSPQHSNEIADAQNSGDIHLRSSEKVTGYHVHATDGEIGHVEEFLIEEDDWCIHFLVVDTKNWWPGKRVLISPRSTRDIDWTDRLVNLSVDRQTVKDSPVYDPSVTVDRHYERHFHDYYGGVIEGT